MTDNITVTSPTVLPARTDTANRGAGFSKRCTALGIEQHTALPGIPTQTAMVERFNGRISDLVQETRRTNSL